MANAFLMRPCVSNRGPVSKFGSYMYDRGQAYVDRTGGSRYHLGVDVPMDQGTPLYGCGDGVVASVRATAKIGYIWVVAINYEVAGVGTVQVQTQHMSRIDVKVGDRVTVKTRIGLSGGTPGTMGAGNSQGAHCHIQVYVGLTLANPDEHLRSRTQTAGGGTETFPMPKPNRSREARMLVQRCTTGTNAGSIVAVTESGGVTPYDNVDHAINDALNWNPVEHPRRNATYFTIDLDEGQFNASILEAYRRQTTSVAAIDAAIGDEEILAAVKAAPNFTDDQIAQIAAALPAPSVDLSPVLAAIQNGDASVTAAMQEAIAVVKPGPFEGIITLTPKA